MDNLCDRLISTIVGEYGIIKVLESVADKSYNQKVRTSLGKLIKEIQVKECKNLYDGSCSCPGCTGRG